MSPDLSMGTALLIVLLATISGCKVGPDYVAPQSRLPSAFAQARIGIAPSMDNPADLAEWWKVFNDALLSQLIRDAASANLDIRLAHARLGEAKARRRFAESALWPGLDATGSHARSRLGKNTTAGRQLTAAGQPLDNPSHLAALDMSWELDFFGGARRNVEAAQADLDASVEQSRYTLVSVLAEIGLSYLDLRGAQKQLSLAQEHLQTQEQTLGLIRDRAKAGLANELDAARAEAQAAATRALIPPLEEAQARSIHRLSVLSGKEPSELIAQMAPSAQIPSAAPRVPIGLPSELLLQRPDLRRAERQIAAATARIGVATADLFPKFNLTAASGFQSVEAGDFLEGGSRFWSLGPTLRWPIFNAGRIRQNIRVQSARKEQALLHYEQTLLKALEEVENSLVSFGREQIRLEALADSEKASRRAVALATDRYRGGLIGFLDVLEAERALLAVQHDAAQCQRQLGQNLIRLYKGLGGGWQQIEKQIQ